MLRKLIDEFMQSQVGLGVLLLRALLLREEKISARRRLTSRVTRDDMFEVRRRFRCREQSRRVGGFALRIKSKRGVAQPAEQQDRDDRNDRPFVLLPKEARLKRGVSGNLRGGGHGREEFCLCHAKVLRA